MKIQEGINMICDCGNDTFYGNQLVRLEIIVDKDGCFESNIDDDATQNIYDAEKPYGPFVCTNCGKEYETL